MLSNALRYEPDQTGDIYTLIIRLTLQLNSTVTMSSVECTCADQATAGEPLCFSYRRTAILRIGTASW